MWIEIACGDVLCNERAEKIVGPPKIETKWRRDRHRLRTATDERQPDINR